MSRVKLRVSDKVANDFKTISTCQDGLTCRQQVVRVGLVEFREHQQHSRHSCKKLWGYRACPGGCYEEVRRVHKDATRKLILWHLGLIQIKIAV